MFREEEGGGPFIGYNKEENPTSNRCGIHIFQKSNIYTHTFVCLLYVRLFRF